MSRFSVRILACLSFAVSVAVYCDPDSFNRDFTYDDKGTVRFNPVVTGNESYYDILAVDYWGMNLSSEESHKSYRPLTTLTFRLCHDICGLDVYWYHITNLVLNGLVSFFGVFIADIVFVGRALPMIICCMLFSVHPIKTEAVSNVSGRAELLMTLFYEIGFLVYVASLRRWRSEQSIVQHCARSFLLPSVFVALSLLSKETGITLLLTCIAYDYMKLNMNVQTILTLVLRGKMDRQTLSARRFLFRAITGLIITLAFAGFSVYIRGTYSPNFIYDQNPAAFHPDMTTRALSIMLVHTLYIESLILPVKLCCDWSGESIDLIQDPFSDSRIYQILAFQIFLWSSFLVSMFSEVPRLGKEKDKWRRVLILGFFGFMIFPFLLSSDVFFVTGTMIGERLAYFPCFGFTIVVAASIDWINSILPGKRVLGLNIILHFLLAAMISFCVVKTQERNMAWSNNLRLWESAYTVNPRSIHVLYQYGYQLSLEHRFSEAVDVLKKLLNKNPQDTNGRFILCLSLLNLDRCDEANEYLQSGLALLDTEMRVTEVTPGRKAKITHDMSNFIGAMGMCSKDFVLQGKLLYKAVELDPSNTYMVDMAMKAANKLKAANVKQETEYASIDAVNFKVASPKP
mmetsp:Transcript_18281/g.23906  ORF Transcript_18281/g.23906 Transcript_18281/m.23906 type:complete len:628 (-) Transcript_18281:119-2002(-)